MTTLIALYLILLSVGCFGLMLYQHWRGTHDLLSVRNFAIVGFVLFQLTSALPPMFTEMNNRYSLQDWAAAGFTFAAMSTVFLGLALFAYKLGFGAQKIVAVLPATRAVPSTRMMFLLAVALTGAAIFGRVGVVIPNATVSALMGKVALAFAASACGMAGWIWAPRLFNPMVAIFACAVIGINLVLVLSETFGRRSLVAVGAALLWGMYYGHWRYLPVQAMLFRMGVISLGPIILLAAFTSVRESQQREAIGTRVKQLATQTDLQTGMLDLLSGQNCAPTSMWLIENYPDRYEYRPLNTLAYFFLLPIPRAIWHTKPEPLSTEIAAKARIEGVREDVLKIGPGIIGHAAAEGGWLALVIYAGAAGFFLRFFDAIVQRAPHNPYLVLPVGSALGQVVGLARGDTSVFAANYVAGVLGGYITLIVIARGLATLGWGRADEPVYDDYAYDGDYGPDDQTRADAALEPADQRA